MKQIQTIIACVLLIAAASTASAGSLDIAMMESTCKISGQGTLGTGFVIGKFLEENPSKVRFVLVTAAHVFQRAQGESVMLTFRQRQEDDTWKRVDFPLQIRSKEEELWQKHPDMDVAAIFVRLPNNCITAVLTTDHLIDEEKIEDYELSPGKELLCLGYPVGAEANALGFSILRSGRIASYPLTPVKDHKTFLFDFTVFPGNSGGPVYFAQKNPSLGKAIHVGRAIGGVVGIVVAARNIEQKVQELYETGKKVTPLQLGEVIHATFIKELIDSMGEPKE